MAVAQIEPFAGPVMAERAWFANQASRGLVRREGVNTHQTLIELMGDRLANRGLSTADVNWDAWRGHDRLWTLRASFRSGSALHEAVFRYDPIGRFSVAVNDEARWLIGEASSSHGPQPGRRTPARDADVDSEPTLDLDVTRVVKQATRTLLPGQDFEPGDFADAQLTQVDGVYDLVSGLDGGMDVLYGMLASINEESVRIYDGLTGATSSPKPAKTNTKTTTRPSSKTSAKPKAAAAAKPLQEQTSLPVGDDEPQLPSWNEEAKEPTVRIPKSKKRVTVPTWDEIMFGSPQAERSPTS